MSGREPRQIRQLAPKFFIFVEGYSEVVYFNRFRVRNLPLCIRVVESKCNDCIGIVKDSIRKLNEFGFDPDRDRAAVVFDVDRNGEKNIMRALNRCEEQGMDMYISNPSYEYWLCLHFGRTRGITAQDDLEGQMSKNLGRKYQKGEDLSRSITEDMITQAVSRASSVLKDGEDHVCRCLKILPSTTLHILVKNLKEYMAGKALHS